MRQLRPSKSAEKVERDAEVRTSPVSVLISKADRRIYVRQGLTPVFDAPAAVHDPKTPLGSHLYIATAVDADGISLKWSVVSMPTQSFDEAAERKNGKTSTSRRTRSSSYSTTTPEEAFERVEIAQDVRDLISERLWTGASIIITDEPLGGRKAASALTLRSCYASDIEF